MQGQNLHVRCPGCGNAKHVPLAVGQQLHCEVCRTKFYSPIVASGEQQPTTAHDAFSVEAPSQMQRRSEASPHTTHDQLPSEPNGQLSVDGAASTKAWQPTAWEAVAQDPSETVEAIDAPPSSGPRSPIPDGDPNAESRGLVWPLLTALAAVIILGTSLGAGVYVLRSFVDWRTADKGAPGSSADVAGEVDRDREFKWTDASRYSQRCGWFTVKVKRVAFGAVRAKDLNNAVITTEDNRLIAVALSIHNRGGLAQPFQTWYGSAFVSDHGDQSLAEMTDSQATHYSQVKFDDVSRVEGQSLADSIASGAAIQDAVVFAVPAEMDRKTIRYFRLSLPGAAVGIPDTFRFQIPVSMIEGF